MIISELKGGWKRRIPGPQKAISLFYNGIKRYQEPDGIPTVYREYDACQVC
jgi:hypothetical protein